MPAWGGTLPSDAIWQLVSYLQSLQPAKDTLSTTSW
jgi:mono/diheme cytochrome c family protein